MNKTTSRHIKIQTDKNQRNEKNLERVTVEKRHIIHSTLCEIKNRMSEYSEMMSL